MTPVALTHHPDLPSAPVRHVSARCARRGGKLTLGYVAKGALDRVRIPDPRVPCMAERLWQHTCFEAFIRVTGAPAYYELNFAPSGAWAAFAFESYREGAALIDPALEPRIAVERDAEHFTLEATVDLDRLSSHLRGAPLSIGLSAVIEDRDGALSYWALAHPPGKPDFHHPDAFALELE